MSEKRYFKIEYDEEWYLFDSTKISEQLVKEQAEYGYGVFANSLSPSEVEGLLNEQQATISSLQTELELTANTKLFSRKELERKVEEQQAEIERLQKIIDLTNYQLKVQDRIIQEMEEKE